MKYIYRQKDGTELELELFERTPDHTLILVEKDLTIVEITSHRWTNDLTGMVAASGQDPGTVLHSLMEHYDTIYPSGWRRDRVTVPDLREMAMYFEELRKEAVAENEDSSWNSPNVFTMDYVEMITQTKRL
jgi:hypothetical protein